MPVVVGGVFDEGAGGGERESGAGVDEVGYSGRGC